MDNPFFKKRRYFFLQLLLTTIVSLDYSISFSQTSFSFPADFVAAESTFLAKDSVFRDSLAALEPVFFSRKILRRRGYKIAGTPFKDERYSVKTVHKNAGAVFRSKMKMKAAVQNDKAGPSEITFYKAFKRDGRITKMILVEALPDVPPGYTKPAYIRYEFAMGDAIRLTTLNFRLKPLSSRTYLKFK